MVKSSNIMKGIFGLLVVSILLFGVGCSKNAGDTSKIEDSTTEDSVIIGVSFAGLHTARWSIERDIIISEAEKLGATVIFESADLDADQQLSQAKNMILQGADVLIVVAHDSEKAAAIVEEAHKAGIKVIAYDRLIKNSDLDYYMSFDNIKVGEYQAKGVLDVAPKGNIAYIGGSPTDNNAYLVRTGSYNILQPKIDSGDITIVLDEFHDGWKSQLAYQRISDYLDNGGTLDGVVVANDGMAAGVIQALKENNLDGKIPVSGQDAALTACRDIVAGTQTVTVYKPVKTLAKEATKIALSIAKNEAVTTNAITNNGKIDVPSVLLDVVLVNKANINDTVIADGFYTLEDVYG
ncbi:MAG TPA: substrate-binding domain-containing protein [Alphaproteobacteria bacterium]|nr:substrate-binding domain-containing protein [Alphaproteobacteria bacterium]